MTSAVPSADSDHDPEFLTRVRAGDPVAWRVLFSRHAVDLVAFARRYVHSDAAAEDVVQDVFARLWDRREEWAPASVRAYLYGATRNRALNVVERQAVEGRHALQIWERAHETPTPVADIPNEAAETDEVLDQLEQLTERQRTALVLRFEHGMKHAEIADALGISLRAAEQLVMRGLKVLRRALDRGRHIGRGE